MTEHSDAAKAAYPGGIVFGAFFEVTGSRSELARIERNIALNEGRLTNDESASLDLWLEMRDEWFALYARTAYDKGAATTYAVTREALATKLKERIGNVRVHHDTPEAVVSERKYWLGIADAILASGALVDANEVKAEALEEAADALPSIEGTQITRQQAAAHWLKERAAEIREGN